MLITTNYGKFFQRWEYQTTLPASWEICVQIKKQQLELDMEQWTGSRFGKAFLKALYCHPAYLTYMWSASWEMPDWMKHRLESRFLEEISTTSLSRWHHPYGRKWRGTDESERGEWVKSCLKTNILKTKIMASGSIMSCQIEKQWKQWQTFFSWSRKSLWMLTAAMKIKDACSLEKKLWQT